jgi:hypothetical protein
MLWINELIQDFIVRTLENYSVARSQKGKVDGINQSLIDIIKL